MDDPRELAIYDVPALDADLAIDFLDDDSLEAMEEGVRKIEATSDLLALVQGVAIVRIEREGLWRQGGYDNLRAYRVAQAARLAMPNSTISLRRKIAEAYLDNRRLLARVDLSGRVAKLPFLSRALRVHDRREALAHFKADSYREFKAWATPRPEREALPDADMRIKDGRILLDGEPLMSLEPELPKEERDFIAEVLRAAYRARRGDCLAHVVAVYDPGEARAVENFLKKLRSGK